MQNNVFEKKPSVVNIKTNHVSIHRNKIQILSDVTK